MRRGRGGCIETRGGHCENDRSEGAKDDWWWLRRQGPRWWNCVLRRKVASGGLLARLTKHEPGTQGEERTIGRPGRLQLFQRLYPVQYLQRQKKTERFSTGADWLPRGKGGEVAGGQCHGGPTIVPPRACHPTSPPLPRVLSPRLPAPARAYLPISRY